MFFDIALTITKWDLLVPPLPERNIWTGITLCPLYFTKSLAHLWTILNTSLCLEFEELIPTAISSSVNICGIKLEIPEVLFFSVSCASVSLKSSVSGGLSFSTYVDLDY